MVEKKNVDKLGEELQVANWAQQPTLSTALVPEVVQIHVLQTDLKKHFKKGLLNQTNQLWEWIMTLQIENQRSKLKYHELNFINWIKYYDLIYNY